MEKEKLEVIDTKNCGPGCACHTPSKGKGVKIIISLLVLAGIIGILGFKFLNGSTESNDSDPANSSVYSAGQAADTDSQPSESIEASSAKDLSKIGEYLKSMGDLNRVALSQDAVFIFIPHDKNEAVQVNTSEAALGAQKTLKLSNITLGLYTLLTDSPDYTNILRQVQPPAILVASKGRGMTAVTGDITESKLLQAFIAASRAGGGCCPSSNSKKSPNCK